MHFCACGRSVTKGRYWLYPSYFKLLGCWLRYSAQSGPRPFGAAASSVQICQADLSLTPGTIWSKLLGMMSLKEAHPAG